jgi:exopolysaccharide production protein ExoY
MATAEFRIYVDRGDEDETLLESQEIVYGPAKPILATGTHAIHCWRYKRVKRLIDIIGAVTMMAVAFIPGLVIGVVVALTSKGPVFYRELRVGQGGRLFKIWKFRSMSVETEQRTSAMLEHANGNLLHWRIHKHFRHPRVTAVGRFLRRWSIDEVPQVINVLMGDMSLIGPRPVIEAEVPMYEHLQGYYLAAAPGMSGLWQVSGRSNIAFKARAELDAAYVRNWSLREDFAILLRTIPAVLKKVGAR